MAKRDDIPMIKAVLFDLDDTLTDRAASLSKYAAHFHREFAGLLGATTVREIESTFVVLDAHGYRPRDEVYAGIVEQLAWAHTPHTSAIRDHWHTWFPQATVARSGALETLAALAAAGLRLGVVTNGSVLTQSAKIAQLGIGHCFATVVISEAAHCKKPDPRIFQYALEEIGRLAGETLFVGDHPMNDVLGSVEAGLIPVWLEGIHVWPSSYAAPDRRIRVLSEVLGFISPQR
jgi:putative hydrolase of the HAD superfamily